MAKIPTGHTKEEIKIREKIIKDFYAKWISEHPNKKVWNKQLGRYIHVKFLSINETYEKAARNFESTCAVFQLTEILENAVIFSENQQKGTQKTKSSLKK